jgi:hypothetical protein
MLAESMRKGNGQEHTEDRQEGTPENRHQRQALPVRHVSQEKPQAGEDASAVVLPQLLETERTIG